MNPKVQCAFDKLVPVGELRPNPRNPNRHPEHQLRLLAAVLREQGWRAPITVSTRSGLVVRGHGRLGAAKLLGCTECPVDYQDYPTDEAELADLIADNRLAELAEMNLGELKDLLQELDTGAVDMELTGFTAEDMERLMTQFYIPAPTIDTDPITAADMDRARGIVGAAPDNSRRQLQVMCPQCGVEFLVDAGAADGD